MSSASRVSLPTLIVLSRERWGFVPRRPQQLASRLARHLRVLYVEEPVRGDGAARLERCGAGVGVEVLCPRTALAGTEADAVGGLLADHLRREGLLDEPLIAWLDTPSALPLLAALEPRSVVYDAWGAAAACAALPECDWLAAADVVIADDPGACAALRRRHANVHCVPGGIDAAAISPERLDPQSREAVAAQRLHAGLARPRFGCFGMAGERLDLDALAALAARRPRWQFVVAGAVGRTPPAHLPQRPNLHWLNSPPDVRLAHLAPHWDACLVPLRPREAARIVALEHLATGKPLIATPQPDLVAACGAAVRTGADGAGLAAACDAALAETAAERAARIEAANAAVARGSWEAAAERVYALIGTALRAEPEPPVPIAARSPIAPGRTAWRARAVPRVPPLASSPGGRRPFPA